MSLPANLRSKGSANFSNLGNNSNANISNVANTSLIGMKDEETKEKIKDFLEYLFKNSNNLVRQHLDQPGSLNPIMNMVEDLWNEESQISRNHKKILESLAAVAQITNQDKNFFCQLVVTKYIWVYFKLKYFEGGKDKEEFDKVCKNIDKNVNSLFVRLEILQKEYVVIPPQLKQVNLLFLDIKNQVQLFKEVLRNQKLDNNNNNNNYAKYDKYSRFNALLKSFNKKIQYFCDIENDVNKRIVYDSIKPFFQNLIRTIIFPEDPFAKRQHYEKVFLICLGLTIASGKEGEIHLMFDKIEYFSNDLEKILQIKGIKFQSEFYYKEELPHVQIEKLFEPIKSMNNRASSVFSSVNFFN